MIESLSRNKALKKSSDKRNRSVRAPSSTVASHNYRENLSHQQSEEKINPSKTNFPQKDELIDVIQSNEKEIDFLNKVISQFLDINELMKIKQNSQYDENTHA